MSLSFHRGKWRIYFHVHKAPLANVFLNQWISTKNALRAPSGYGKFKMTIELAASRKALTNAQLDLDDVAVTPDHLATAWVGVDLTLLGACTPAGFDEAPIDHLNYPRLAASVKAAQQGGIDFVTLGLDFHNSSDSAGSEYSLDAVKTAARLADVSTAGVFAGVVGTPKDMNVAVDLLASQTDGWAGITITLATDSDFDGIVATTKNARAAGIRICVIITNPSITPGRAKLIASIADTVRLRVADPHAAREARFAIRAAGQEINKDVLVFVELGIVISASVEAAEERAHLIEKINGCDPFEGIACVLGTVYSVADAIESWVGLGAADGIILVPASLPTDLASVLRGVLPLMEARAQLDRA